MSRAVVHKTKGKLDLRSLTVFGLNAKPETDTPIGYFGTGLKYAVAVLARNNIPITFWIGGKKWTVEQDDTKFRDKSFRALFLKRHTFVPKTINLPFTTELGKNWELWQAFRELEANTRDENGQTTVLSDISAPLDVSNIVGYTLILVDDERYVQEYFDRDKTFLPDGLTKRDDTNQIQVFTRKSNAIYYRGIRIHELKEPSENTYNILSQIELTEDRTAKNVYAIEWLIESYLANQTTDKEIIKRAVSAPPKSYERNLDYAYTGTTDIFLDTVSELGEDATDHARSILRRDRPPEEPKETYANWIRDLIAAIERGDYDRVEEVIKSHKTEMIQNLGAYATTLEKEDANNSQGTSDDIVGAENDSPTSGPVAGGYVSRGATISYVLDQADANAQEVRSPEPDIYHGIDDISSRKGGYDDIPF